jgi:hypothetical protein
MLARELVSKLRSKYIRAPGIVHMNQTGGSELEALTSLQKEILRNSFPRTKFFIIGYPRSGTTLLARLTRLHPEVHCNWQAQFFSERGPIPLVASPQFQAWIKHRSNHWTEGENFTAPMLRAFYDYVLESGAQAANKQIVGDKSPNDNGVQAVDWLSKIYPDAYLMYIVRDGRDAVFSKRIQAFIDQPQHLDREDRKLREALLKDPQPFLDGKRSFFSKRWLVRTASQWATDVHECAAAAQEVFSDRFLLIKYEELLAEPLKCMTQAFNLLGAGEADLEGEILKEMENNPSAEWHRSRGYEFTRHIPRGKHGIWREVFTDEDIRLFRDAAGEVLSEFGYAQG